MAVSLFACICNGESPFEEKGAEMVFQFARPFWVCAPRAVPENFFALRKISVAAPPRGGEE